jgi:DNA end-binding protein Ku
LEAVAIESARTIDISEFVPKDEIDELYLAEPYYIVPDGEVGEDAFAVIREAIRKEGMVALGRVVFTSREHMIALEARDKGMLGMTLRYPYEVRDPAEYFDDLRDVKITKDMLDLAQHIVESKTASFDPSKFEDRYETALKDLLKQKQAGRPVKAVKHAAPTNVVNLMDALRRSIGAEKSAGRAAGRPAQNRRAPSKRSGARVRRAG